MLLRRSNLFITADPTEWKFFTFIFYKQIVPMGHKKTPAAFLQQELKRFLICQLFIINYPFIYSPSTLLLFCQGFEEAPSIFTIFGVKLPTTSTNDC